ncbi:unnamed protein product [Urochloa decumbens]|uniref:F-box domain-containing protein n=1 Tax=Urochloa decumbens TaxID=240449 RepID=A0ABC8W0B5_9POAL
MSDGGWDGIPADVFLDILLRIPLCPRRRLRLVCRHWRDIIDERAPEPRACAKVLAFSNDGGPHRAYIIDDLTHGGVRRRELDLLHHSRQDAAEVRLIGTCNGLLCLLRSHDIAVINPATRELLAVGLPSACYYGRNEATYSFGYHPATGRYKIVHVPHYRAARLDAVRVLTLGDHGPGAAWRDVPAPPGSSCLLRFGLVTVGAGVTYWVTEDAKRIMSLDLKDDRVAVVESPPMPVPLVPFNGYGPEYVNAYPCRLTEVHGKLGLAARRPCDGDMSKTEVWVLEGGKEQEMAWVKRCTVLAGGAVTRQEIALPHAMHGEHVLTTYMPGVLSGRQQLTLSAHRPRDERKTRPCGVVRVDVPKPETVVGVFESCGVRTFAYVETGEPLSFYGDKLYRQG